MNLAILVKTCHQFRSRRLACDETWCSAIRRSGIGVHFILGGSQSPGIGSIQGASCWIDTTSGDEYKDNSNKLREAIETGLVAFPFDFLFICDDDTFVHPQRWLDHEPTGDLECRVYQPRNAIEWKKNNGRPWIHGGAGWWMSRRMCELYAEHCHERTSADDILAARIAQEHGIELVDRPDLYGCNRYGGNAGLVSADNSLITCHPVSPAEMKTLYEATRGI